MVVQGTGGYARTMHELIKSGKLLLQTALRAPGARHPRVVAIPGPATEPIAVHRCQWREAARCRQLCAQPAAGTSPGQGRGIRGDGTELRAKLCSKVGWPPGRSRGDRFWAWRINGSWSRSGARRGWLRELDASWLTSLRRQAQRGEAGAPRKRESWCAKFGRKREGK